MKGVKTKRSVVERRGYDSGVFHDGCRAEVGFLITLLHSVPIDMPLCHLQVAQRGGGEESYCSGRRGENGGREERRGGE